MDNNPNRRNCPALMSDARFACDYRPKCTVNMAIQIQNNITDSYSYRMFLQQNGQAIINLERQHFIQKNGCKPCDAPKVSWSHMEPLRN